MNAIIKPHLLRNALCRNININATRNLRSSCVVNNSFKVQDENDFVEKIEKRKGPIIVDFFATWCGPCKALEPRLEKVISKHKGELAVAKVDIDNLGEVAAKYEVGTIPALVVFRDGKVEERLIGLQDEDKLNSWVDKVMNK